MAVNDMVVFLGNPQLINIFCIAATIACSLGLAPKLGINGKHKRISWYHNYFITTHIVYLINVLVRYRLNVTHERSCSIKDWTGRVSETDVTKTSRPTSSLTGTLDSYDVVTCRQSHQTSSRV